MDEFTSRIDELNSQITRGINYGSQQKIDTCNGSGSASTSYFTSPVANHSATGPTVRHSSSSTQLAKDSALVEEVIMSFSGSCPTTVSYDLLISINKVYMII